MNEQSIVALARVPEEHPPTAACRKLAVAGASSRCSTQQQC